MKEKVGLVSFDYIFISIFIIIIIVVIDFVIEEKGCIFFFKFYGKIFKFLFFKRIIICFGFTEERWCIGIFLKYSYSFFISFFFSYGDFVWELAR